MDKGMAMLKEALEKDDFMKDTGELLACARTNFEVVERMLGFVEPHPVWMIAMAQLKAAEKRLRK